MKFTKVLKDKKGAALEMAILFMVIVFCFCTLLTTMTLTARSRIKLEKVYFNLDLNEDLNGDMSGNPNADIIVADCLAYLEMIALKNSDQQAGIFKANAETELKNDPTKDDVAAKFTEYILSRHDTTEIPSIYDSYIRDHLYTSNKKVIHVVTTGHIDLKDFKTLSCTLILDGPDRILIQVDYTFEAGALKTTITQLVK